MLFVTQETFEMAVRRLKRPFPESAGSLQALDVLHEHHDTEELNQLRTNESNPEIPEDCVK